jgi:hypothetical protein
MRHQQPMQWPPAKGIARQGFTPQIARWIGRDGTINGKPTRPIFH